MVARTHMRPHWPQAFCRQLKLRPPHKQHSAHDAGFTLVETLIALLIFALLAGAGTVVLRGSLNSQAAVSTALEQQQNLLLARTIIKWDMAQTALRPTRSSFGTYVPAFVGGDIATSSAGLPRLAGETLLLTFTRRGLVDTLADTPAAEKRGDAQRVFYLMRESALIRRTLERPDAVPQTRVQDQILLSGITSAAVRFYSGRTWQDNWQTGSVQNNTLPTALELTLQHADGGTTQHVFLLRAGDAR